jgi:intraflagellar transport protein 46
MTDSGGSEFSNDELDDSAFEESLGGMKKETSLANDKYDMALDVSQSASGDFDALTTHMQKEKVLRNDKFDEALDVSGSANDSMDSTALRVAASESKRKAQTIGGMPIKNDQFDETFDVSDGGEGDSSVDTTQGAKEEEPGAGRQTTRRVAGGESPTAAAVSSTAAAPSRSPPKLSATARGPLSEGASETESEDDDEDDGEGEGAQSGRVAQKLEGAYNPDEYANLNVSSEIKDLFQYILRYKPHEVELETTLKCFVPDYIPAVGEMDAFVKVPPPDGKPDDLGLKVLDEPAAHQSDATVLELQLRAVSKKQHGEVAVRSIEDAHKRPQDIDRWIKSIEDLHRSKPPPQVHYKRTMPDIDSLMEVWPDEMERVFERVPVRTLVDLCCSILQAYTRFVHPPSAAKPRFGHEFGRLCPGGVCLNGHTHLRQYCRVITPTLQRVPRVQ